MRWTRITFVISYLMEIAMRFIWGGFGFGDYYSIVWDAKKTMIY
jgi:hypothetical protein